MAESLVVSERETHARALVRKLKAIREPRMRCASLAEYLAREPAERIVAVLAEVVGRVREFPEFQEAADALSATLIDPDLVEYDLRSRIYSQAKAAGCDEVARLFFDVSPMGEADRELIEELSGERAVVPGGRQLTLGERKSLARGHRRDMLEHLLRDSHPDVVTILLDNPHVTERDVLVIASRRPSPPVSLAAVAANHRWRTRYSVKRALVMNPHTPPHLAMRLATGLRPADLRAVRDDPNLAEPLRQQAGELIERRAPG
jgi:hypothetical protein